jgi:AraC-like DNA-binding protein
MHREPPQATMATQTLQCPAALRDRVDGVLAVRIEPGDAHGATLPYDGLLLAVRLPHPALARETRVDAWLWPLRSRPGRWLACPDGCLTLLAMLRPVAALSLMREQRFGDVEPVATPLAALAGGAAATRLETAVLAARGDVDAQLRALARWLEAETVLRNGQREAASLRRIGAAAEALHRHASLPVAEVAARVGVHRRQLERDFGRWFAASPKQVQMAARLQHAARLAWRGAAAGDVAAGLGFVDAPHLAHTVRELTGMTFGQWSRSDALPLARGFRIATGGAHLFA